MIYGGCKIKDFISYETLAGIEREFQSLSRIECFEFDKSGHMIIDDEPKKFISSVNRIIKEEEYGTDTAITLPKAK